KLLAQRCPRWLPSASGPVARWSEQHDRADRLAGFEGGEPVIDLGQRDMPGDQLVEIEAAVEVGAREEREVARRPGAAIARTADALLGHQAAPAESDLVLHIDLAEPDDLAARPHRLDRDAEPGGTAGRLEHDIDAAPAGPCLDDRDGILAAGCSRSEERRVGKEGRSRG